MTIPQILIGGVLVAVGAILVGALTDISVPVAFIFLLAAVVFLAFATQGGRRRRER